MSDRSVHDREDKLEAGSLTASSPALKWLDNFWYHYKWTVIVVAFFVVVLIVCTVQLLSRPNYDTSVVLGCTYRMNSDEHEALNKLLVNICPSDFNGDGEKQINIMDYQVYSEEEYVAEAESYEAESDHFPINRQYNTDEYNNFNNYTLTGESSVYIISPYLYELLRTSGRLLPLSDIYTDGELPTGAMADGYGIALSETDFYRYHPEVQMLPNSLILCLHRPTISGNSSREELYENEKTFFRAIADFEVKE